jgi:hypothetical protein
LLVASALAAAVAGCGSSSSSSNGEQNKSAATILSDARSAAQSAKSVHLAGNVNQGGRQLGLNLDINSGTGGKGTISVGGNSVQVVRVNDNIYFNGNAAFYHLVGAPSGAAKVLAGRWIKTPVNASDAASFAKLTDLKQLFSTLTAKGSVSKGGTATSSTGTKVVVLNDHSDGSTLYVSLTGKPYPVEAFGGGKGTLTFTNWDQPVKISPPSNVLDFSQGSR